MPKKKQVIFQNSIPGKFIPRNDPPPGSVFRSGTTNNRFSARMAELLASASSSATEINESQLVSIESPRDDLPTMNIPQSSAIIDATNMHSKLLHRRIVTMIETSKKPNEEQSTISPSVERHSQPITFGQLRQGAVSSSFTTIIEDKSKSEEKYHKTLASFKSDRYPDSTLQPSTPYQTSKEQVYYSSSLSSLEQSFEKQNVISQTKKEEGTKLTVDEILATYYSKTNPSTNSESQLPPPAYSNTSTGFYIHPSGSRWNTLHGNQQPIPPPPRLMLNEQNQSRPPPPSYSSSLVQSRRTPSTVVSTNQHIIHQSSLLEHLYPDASTSQHLFAEHSSIRHSNSVSSFVSTLTNPINNNNNNSIRPPPPPPPRYKSPTSNTERRSSSTSSQTSKTAAPANTTSSPGFDRKFSRLLYGKETSKTRRQREKRKAYSDPDKKSVEAVRRLFEKNRRRVTSHLHRIDKLSEDDDTETESLTKEKKDFRFFPRRRFQRQADTIEKHRESAKKAIVPANPLLKRRIPSFLRIYSQASSSNDILLHWHLFNLSELDSFNSMMTRLYKNENLARVQLYEIYRSALHSALASKTDDESDAIHTLP